MLAAGALVASILAVGATPAAAGEQQPDARSTWLACVGAAKSGGGFTDVDMGSPHYDNINCLAYYGITTGKTADTYDPQSNVTRSQMALFLTRAADKAGIALGDAMDMGFTDLGMTGADRVAAINVLASKGIMPGRTATTFDPEGTVTRADMAQHLFTLLDLALDSVHIDRLPDTADGDGTGIELNVSGGDGDRPNDYFGDVRRTQPVHIADMINAIYELGVTNGTNNMVGENGTFEPTRPVTRAQMASFIMRTMGHTNLRPAGLTAQQTPNQTQVSVRNANFEPVVGSRVELIASAYPEDAFDRNGRCITDPAYVTGTIGGVATSGFDACSIDIDDERTDTMGNFVFDVGSLTGVRFEVDCSATVHPATNPTPGDSFRFVGDPGAPATVWAWQGDMDDIVDSNTDRVEPVAGNSANPGRATQATISGGSDYTVRMGRTLTYTIQLRNALGQPVGPIPGENNSYNVTIIKAREANAGDATYTVETLRQTTPHTPDGSGLITISITNPDPVTYPVASADDPDVQVTVIVTTAAANDLPLVARTGGTTSTDRAAAATSGTPVVRVDPPAEVFSDNTSAVTSFTAAPAAQWMLRSGLASRNRNSISVQVFDQYGDLFRGATHEVSAASTSGGSFPTASDANEYAVGSSGSRSFTYTLDSTVAAATTETVTLTLQLLDDSSPLATTQSVVVQWADRGQSSSSGGVADPVLVGDPRSNTVVVNENGAGAPAAYEYGPDDTFFVEGDPVTLAQFEEVLGSIGSKATDPIASLGNLVWARYDFSRPRDGATWELTGLSCRPSAATR